jgi:GT2 family glycosyltransferase
MNDTALIPSTLPEKPAVSLLLPVYNTARVLDIVLQRLADNTTYDDIELIAVDDGSTDESPEILRRWRDSGRFPRFELITKPNGGAIESLNTALTAAGGDVCVQLDSDASIESHGWLERMLNLLQTDDRVGVVTVKTVFDSGAIHACGVNLLGREGHLARPSRITEPIGRRTWHYCEEEVPEDTSPLENLPAEVDAGIGCCLMYRRADAVTAGGYDTGYSPVWFDDLDLCVSIRAQGRKVFYTPDVYVLHRIQGRKPPEPVTLAQRAKAAARAATPAPIRASIRRRRDPGRHYSDQQRERLLHHYAYWRSKWGWDFLNPDLAAMQERWGDTEIWWREDPERRAVGQRILAAASRVQA